ncbi:MAG: peptidoglycan-associated lipoprotein Pal [Roseovarius sp.]
MKLITKSVILCATMALAGCANDRFDTDGSATNLNANSGNAGITPGSAQDPNSPLYFQQTVGDRVLFEVDQSTLTATGRSILDGQASWLSTNPQYNALIEGHADEQGTRQYNLALGARRANSVQEYMISRGVPANRIKVVSYGKERPIEICSEESCYAKNRRAVTVVSVVPTS